MVCCDIIFCCIDQSEFEPAHPSASSDSASDMHKIRAYLAGPTLYQPDEGKHAVCSEINPAYGLI